MKINYLLIVSKLILLLEIKELFKSWERPTYVIKSKGPFAFPSENIKNYFKMFVSSQPLEVSGEM